MRADAMLALMPYMAEEFANPSAGHAMARDAKHAVETAREQVAAAVGCRPLEVIFTSGGTESDNLAVRGAAVAARQAGFGIGVVTATIEHKAVLAPARHLATEGFRVAEVRCDANGVIDPDAFAAALDADTVLVSVMLVNNEVGAVQPLAQLIDIARARAPHAVVHTDAVQAVPWLDIASHAAGADLISISAHKFGGPKGTGALVVRDGTALEPLIEGGGQERGLRPGTLNVHGIVGMGTAIAETVARRAEEVTRVKALRDRFAKSVLAQVPGSKVNGDLSTKVAGNCHIGFDGIEAESLLFLLDRDGVYASAGSACSSGAIEPSHVLLAMGLTPEAARSSVRFSLGHTTTDTDIDRAIDVIVAAVAQLRGAPARTS